MRMCAYTDHSVLGRHRRYRQSRSDCSAHRRAALLNRRATWRRARRHRPGAGGGRGGGRHGGRALMRSISVCRLVMRSSRLRILVASFCCLSVRPCVAAYARQSACRQHAFCLTTGSAGVQPFCSSSRSLQAPQHCNASQVEAAGVQPTLIFFPLSKHLLRAPQHCNASTAGCRRVGSGQGRRRAGAAPPASSGSATASSPKPQETPPARAESICALATCASRCCRASLACARCA